MKSIWDMGLRELRKHLRDCLQYRPVPHPLSESYWDRLVHIANVERLIENREAK